MQIAGGQSPKKILKFQKQPNRWSCLPTAFAILLDIPVDNIIKEIGHDGSMVIDPDKPEPLNRRGFHIQELVHYCNKYDLAVTIFEPLPCFDNYNLDLSNKVNEIIFNNPGILLGVVDDQKHAVVWDTEKVIDPNGTTYNINKFQIEIFIKVSPSYQLT